MWRDDDFEPAMYSPSNIKENDAISVFEKIIDRKYVKSFISRFKNIPNHDGYLELTNDDQRYIGEIKVQMKKLSDRYLEDPKYPCDIGFLGYCIRSLSPVLLILVDTKNNVSYWKHIDRDFIKNELKLKKGQKSKIVHVPKRNIIREGDNSYLQEWIKIIEGIWNKLGLYNSQKNEIDKLQETVERLLENSDPLLGLEQDEFKDIHRFLDRFNNRLDTYFSIVKKLQYDNCWKVGFAYGTYTKSSLSYILYPIDPAKNDLQIRKLSNELIDRLPKEHRTKSLMFQENLIYLHPEAFADNLIKEKLNKLFAEKTLPLRNLFLAREIIFSFVDKYFKYLGIEKKNKYNVVDVINSLHTYLLVWLEEAIKKGYLSNRAYTNLDSNLLVDLDSLVTSVSREKIEELNHVAFTRIENGELSENSFLIESSKYPLKLIFNLFDYLKQNGIRKIERVYIPQDNKLVRENSYIWSYYTKNDIQANVEAFYQNLPNVYDSIVDEFFPLLKRDICFFSHFDRLILITDFTNYPQNVPIIYFYCLKNKNFREEKIDFYIKNKNSDPTNLFNNLTSDVEIYGQQYNLVLSGFKSLLFTFGSLPMYNYIYNLLDKKIKNFMLMNPPVPNVNCINFYEF